MMPNNEAPPRLRTAIPIIPTLIIGVGRFGKEVGVQLAARLSLTEDGLRSISLKRSLLVHTDENDNLSPGFVRIMELNWKQWIGSGYLPDAFLTDITISGASVAEEGTPSQPREEDMLAADQVEALDALPKMMELLQTVLEPLRIHDMPMQMGDYDTYRVDQHFKMRVIVVCSAREAETAALLPRLIELLGEVYVTTSQLARGIEIFCHVGATSLKEHRLANGDDNEYDQLFDSEVARILPVYHRTSKVTKATGDSLLDKLGKLWYNKTPQFIEACYVVDTQLANSVTAVQLRDDEPNEAIIAIALAIIICITGDADSTVRRIRSRRWDMSTAYTHTEQGLFSSFGVGSYSLDHPRLRRLIYDYVVGMFLQRVQPPMYGDQGRQRTILSGHQEDELLDGELETLQRYNLQKALMAYELEIASRSIESKMPKAGSDIDSRKIINYRKAISLFERIEASDRAKIKDELERLIAHMTDKMGESALQLRIQNRERRYLKLLDDASFKPQDEIFLSQQAPFVQIYRFVLHSLETLREEARKANAPATGPNLLVEKRELVAEKSRLYNEEVARRVDSIKRELKHQPNPVGAMGRAFVLAPILVICLIPLWNTVSSLFNWLSPTSEAVSFYNTLMALPAWMVPLCVAIPLWIAIFLIHRAMYRHRIGRQLRGLVKRYETLLKEADFEAWRWALAEALTDKESLTNKIKPLSRPGGIFAKLRDELLAGQFSARDRLLERIFFDNELQNNLKEIGRTLAGLDRLWQRRRALFEELINGQLRDKDDVQLWLRLEAERIHTRDSYLITDLVGSFLKHQTEQRLEEMWHTLSTIAVPFLRSAALSQDDPTIPVELFGLHGPQDVSALNIIMRHSGVEVLNSADVLRWIFMRTRVGIHMECMKFAIEAQLQDI